MITKSTTPGERIRYRNWPKVTTDHVIEFSFISKIVHLWKPRKAKTKAQLVHQAAHLDICTFLSVRSRVLLKKVKSFFHKATMEAVLAAPDLIPARAAQ